MFKLDNAFLEELGLGSLPAVEKNKMLAHIYETLEMRVGMKLAEQMTNEQLDEFEGYINRQDEAGALKWLESNFPNYKQVVAEELEKLKGEVRQVAPQVLAQAAQANPAGSGQPQSPQPQQQYTQRQNPQPQLSQQPLQQPLGGQYPNPSGGVQQPQPTAQAPTTAQVPYQQSSVSPVQAQQNLQPIGPAVARSQASAQPAQPYAPAQQAYPQTQAQQYGAQQSVSQSSQQTPPSPSQLPTPSLGSQQGYSASAQDGTNQFTPTHQSNYQQDDVSSTQNFPANVGNHIQSPPSAPKPYDYNQQAAAPPQPTAPNPLSSNQQQHSSSTESAQDSVRPQQKPWTPDQ